jgi:hypothetical protein
MHSSKGFRPWAGMVLKEPGRKSRYKKTAGLSFKINPPDQSNQLSVIVDVTDAGLTYG